MIDDSQGQQSGHMSGPALLFHRELKWQTVRVTVREMKCVI